jgi:glycerophosphoryl diester phosphodiesterase
VTFPYRGKGHRVPSFDEVLEAFPSIPTLVEIKTVEAALAVRRCIEGHRAEDRTLVDSMEGDAMRVFTDSAIAIGAARGDVIRAMTELLLHLPLTPFAYRALCVPLSHNGIPVPVVRFARAAKSQNCVVHVWTINHPAVATRLWKQGVQGIITDDPAVMLRARALLPR